MRVTHRFKGRLTRPPFPGRPFRSSNFIFPFQTEHDFAICQQLASPKPGTQAFITYDEKYELLELMIRAAGAMLQPVDYYLLRIHMPGSVRLPDRMLAPDVFISPDFSLAREQLLAEGRHLLTIDERLFRHPLEPTDNTLKIEWYAPQADEAAFNAFTKSLAQYGIAPD